MLLVILPLASPLSEAVWWRRWDREFVHMILLLYLIKEAENDRFQDWRDELL
jgi:hypothetical protein